MPRQDQPDWGRFVGLGIEMAVGVALGWAVGWWLDRKSGSAPWGSVVGGALGFAAGMYMLIKEALKANRD